MPVLISMPKLGMNMTRGTIVNWLVQEGAQVQPGQLLLAVETDKVTQEIESPVGGILARIVRHEGADVPCLTVLGVIVLPGEPLPREIPDVISDGVAPWADVEVTVPNRGMEAGPEQKDTTGTERINISPLAKKLARELGIDVSELGAGGKRVTREDVEAAYRARQAAGTEQEPEESATSTPEAASTIVLPPSVPPPAVETRPFEGVRRTIAERMSQSARTVARVGLSLEADAGQLAAWRERFKSQGHSIGLNEFLAKLVAQALLEFPYMNAELRQAEIRQPTDINIGIATDTERGLLVPVIRKVNLKGIVQISREFHEMVERAREGKSKLEDLEAGTFTITNLGMYEIEEFLPIINLPECAILGVGAIIQKPVAVDDRVEIRPRMALTLAFDHRLVDGAPAARFLQRVKHLIQDPLLLPD